MFSIITTTIEILGAIMIAAGIGLCFGWGAALIAGGTLILAGSYFANRASLEGVSE